MGSAVEREKKAAAEAAVLMVKDGMTVGLGTGTTVAHLLPALAVGNCPFGAWPPLLAPRPPPTRSVSGSNHSTPLTD